MNDLNDENFRAAVSSLRETEDVWSKQIELLVGHPVVVTLDFDSLGGQFARVQPFIHQALAGVIGAFPSLAGDRATWGEFLERMQRAVISAAEANAPCTAQFEGNALHIRVPLVAEDIRPPALLVLNALRAVLGLAALPELGPVTAFQMGAPIAAGSDTQYDGDPVQAPSFTGDPYAYASQFVVDLQQAMHDDGLWPGPKPPGEIEIRGAFGSENMPFEHWLAWVLIPRVEEIIRARGKFPGQSNIAAYAVRALDGADANDTISVLIAFDDVVNGLP